MLQRPEDGFAAFFYSIRKVYWTYFRYYQREIQSGKRKIRMAKTKKTVFFCQNCGHEEAKWLGQCPVVVYTPVNLSLEQALSVKILIVNNRKKYFFIFISPIFHLFVVYTLYHFHNFLLFLVYRNFQS